MTESKDPLSLHVARAALRVAAILGDRDASVVVAKESYWKRATGGVFSPADLQRGEDALVDAGFVVRDKEHLTLTPRLAELADAAEEDAIEVLAVALLEPLCLDTAMAGIEDVLKELIEDPSRRELIVLALGRHFDDSLRREVGDIGEELVVAHARAELATLGYPDLSAKVRRVSLVSDQLGYDVTAPRLAGSDRRLEVKATTTGGGEVFLSRNEADVGARFADWSLVVCEVTNIDRRTGSVLGWCNRAELGPFLPTDSPGGTWQSAAIELARLPLQPGLPRPTA